MFVSIPPPLTSTFFPKVGTKKKQLVSYPRSRKWLLKCSSYWSSAMAASIYALRVWSVVGSIGIMLSCGIDSSWYPAILRGVATVAWMEVLRTPKTELLWLKYFLKDLGSKQQCYIVLRDNQKYHVSCEEFNLSWNNTYQDEILLDPKSS